MLESHFILSSILVRALAKSLQFSGLRGIKKTNGNNLVHDPSMICLSSVKQIYPFVSGVVGTDRNFVLN